MALNGDLAGRLGVEKGRFDDAAADARVVTAHDDGFPALEGPLAQK
jgi:hypothetical protein